MKIKYETVFGIVERVKMADCHGVRAWCLQRLQKESPSTDLYSSKQQCTLNVQVHCLGANDVLNHKHNAQFTYTVHIQRSHRTPEYGACFMEDDQNRIECNKRQFVGRTTRLYSSLPWLRTTNIDSVWQAVTGCFLRAPLTTVNWIARSICRFYSWDEYVPTPHSM